MRDEFNLRREYMLERLSKMPHLSVVRPNGAFYVLVNISKLGLTSQNFADRLLSKANVAVVPGIAFGDDRTAALQLCHEPGCHQEGHGPVRRILSNTVTVSRFGFCVLVLRKLRMSTQNSKRKTQDPKLKTLLSMSTRGEILGCLFGDAAQFPHSGYEFQAELSLMDGR